MAVRDLTWPLPLLLRPPSPSIPRGELGFGARSAFFRNEYRYRVTNGREESTIEVKLGEDRNEIDTCLTTLRLG